MKYTRCPYNDSSKIICKVTKTDYVWFEFLWIRRYELLKLVYVHFSRTLVSRGQNVQRKSQFKELSAFKIDLNKTAYRIC